jgi:hypothetical protein
MCESFSELTKVYSHEELNQGLWAVFGASISCERYLFDPTVDLGLRIGCIESMYIPFRDVVGYILHTFWHTYYATEDYYQKLSADGRQMFDAMYQTLLKILALDHLACQWSALHGLGHLRDPQGLVTMSAGSRRVVTEQIRDYLPSLVCATACAR